MFGNSDITSRLNVVSGDVSGLRVFERAQKEVDDLRRSTVAATGAADKLGDKLAKAARGADFGRTGGGLERVLGGAIGAGSQELLGLAGDIGDVIEGLAAEPGGLKGALKGLVSPAGLLSVGLAGAGLAMAAFTAEIERQRESAKEMVNDLVAAAQSEEVYRQLLESSGTAAIESAKQQQESQFAIAEAAHNALVARKAELEATVNAQRARGTFLTQEQADLDEVTAAYEKNKDVLYGANQNILILNEIMGGTEFAAKRAAEGFDTLTRFIDTGRAAVDGIAGVVTGALDAIGEMADETAAAAAEAAEEFTKLQDSVQSAVDKLDADGTKLGDELRRSIADLNQQAVDAQIDAAAEIADAQIEAARNRLEAESQFNKESNRAYEDFRAEQRRIREDADRAEKSAIESNDILALLDINEQATVEKQRNRDRFETERQRRAEDFADRQAAEAAALELTIAGINQRRDEELANIAAEITAERTAFDEAIALIELQKAAQIAQIDAVAAANETRYAAEEAAIDRIATKMQALVVYQNGKLISLNPGLLNSPQTAGSLLGLPPPPTDPFGLGQFFGGSSLPPPRDPGLLFAPERAASTPPTQIVLNEGSVVVGDLASREDIFSAFRTLAAVLFQARTGVAA